jgi:hypothetical protein
MDNFFVGIVGFLLGCAAMHLYKKTIIEDLTLGINVWKANCNLLSEQLLHSICRRPHISDLDTIEAEARKAAGLPKADLKLVEDE